MTTPGYGTASTQLCPMRGRKKKTLNAMTRSSKRADGIRLHQHYRSRVRVNSEAVNDLNQYCMWNLRCTTTGRIQTHWMTKQILCNPLLDSRENSTYLRGELLSMMNSDSCWTTTSYSKLTRGYVEQWNVLIIIQLSPNTSSCSSKH